MYKMMNHINEQYKIKIYCTTRAQLLINGIPISIGIKNMINNSLLPEYDDDINEICILYKKLKNNNYRVNYTVKSLEIFYNSYITEDEFISYIKYMHYAGFSSENNNIEFINIQTNKIIYKYDFVNIVPVENETISRNINKSFYTKSKIYI